MNWMNMIDNFKNAKDFFTDKSTIELKKMSDYEVGKLAIKHFHDAAVLRKKLVGKSVYGLDKLIDNLEKIQGGKSQIAGLGMGIKLIDIGEYEIRLAMNALAEKTNGDFPKDINHFRQAVIDHENYLANTVVEAYKDYAEITRAAYEKGKELVVEAVDSTTFLLKNRKTILIWGGVLATIFGVYLLSTKADTIKGLIGGKKAS